MELSFLQRGPFGSFHEITWGMVEALALARACSRQCHTTLIDKLPEEYAKLRPEQPLPERPSIAGSKNPQRHRGPNERRLIPLVYHHGPIGRVDSTSLYIYIYVFVHKV